MEEVDKRGELGRFGHSECIMSTLMALWKVWRGKLDNWFCLIFLGLWSPRVGGGTSKTNRCRAKLGEHEKLSRNRNEFEHKRYCVLDRTACRPSGRL